MEQTSDERGCGGRGNAIGKRLKGETPSHFSGVYPDAEPTLTFEPT